MTVSLAQTVWTGMMAVGAIFVMIGVVSNRLHAGMMATHVRRLEEHRWLGDPVGIQTEVMGLSASRKRALLEFGMLLEPVGVVLLVCGVFLYFI